MNRTSISSLLSLLVAGGAVLALAGCGEDSGCPAQVCVGSHAEVDTEAGLYYLELVPETVPRAGAMELDLTVMTAQQRMAIGEEAGVSVSLWMPAHGHGMGEKATTEYLEDGRYLVSWTFPMSGYWEQTIEINGASGRDYAVVGYQVQ